MSVQARPSNCFVSAKAMRRQARVVLIATGTSWKMSIALLPAEYSEIFTGRILWSWATNLCILPFCSHLVLTPTPQWLVNLVNSCTLYTPQPHTHDADDIYTVIHMYCSHTELPTITFHAADNTFGVYSISINWTLQTCTKHTSSLLA